MKRLFQDTEPSIDISIDMIAEEEYKDLLERPRKRLVELCNAGAPTALRYNWVGYEPFLRKICIPNGYFNAGLFESGNGAKYLVLRKVTRPKEIVSLEEACKQGEEIALSPQMWEEHKELLHLFGYRRTSRGVLDGEAFEIVFVPVSRPMDSASLKEACKRRTEVLIPQALKEEESQLLDSFGYSELSSSINVVVQDGDTRYEFPTEPLVEPDPQNAELLHFIPPPLVLEVFPSLSELVEMLIQLLQREIIDTLCQQWEMLLAPPEVSLERLMRCFQLALAIGDKTGETCSHLNIQECISQLWKDTSAEAAAIYSQLMKLWKGIGSSDGMSAWAAYHVGLFCKSCHRNSEHAISLLEMSYKHAKTSKLRYYTSDALAKLYKGKKEGLEDALKWYQRQKQAAKDLSNRECICFALLNACKIYCRSSLRAEAQQVVEEVEKMADECPNEKFYKVLSLKMHGMVAFCFANYDESKRAYENCIEVAASIPIRHHLSKWACLGSNDTSYLVKLAINKWIQEANAYLKFIEQVQADDFDFDSHGITWDDACQRFRESTHDASRGAALLMLATSIQTYDEESIEVKDILLSEAANLLIARELFSCLNVHAVNLLLVRQYDRAVMQFEKCLELFLHCEKSFGAADSAVRISYLQEAKDVFLGVHISLVESESPQVGRALVWAERGRARDLIYGLNQRLKSEHYKNDMSLFDHSIEEAWSEIESICRTAGGDTVFLVYSKYQDKILKYFLHPDLEAQCNVSIFPSSLIEEFCKHPEWPNSWELFKELIYPWRSQLEAKSIKNIMIIPTEELSILPFAALFDQDTKQFLIQRYAIAIVPSIRMFRQCKERWMKLSEEAMTKVRQALVVGNPTKDLNRSKIEVDIVETSLAGMQYEVVTLREEEATTKAVLGLLPTATWIHISSHALVDNVYPKGVVKLAPSSSIEENDMFEAANIEVNFNHSLPESELENISKGLLTGHMIEQVKELKSEVAVLSACQTGLGQLCLEGILGLCRAFHMTGIPTVIISLRKVDDECNMKFMEKFYTGLYNGKDLMIAFQQAMQGMIIKDNRGRHCPRKWAMFALSGCPQV